MKDLQKTGVVHSGVRAVSKHSTTFSNMFLFNVCPPMSEFLKYVFIWPIRTSFHILQQEKFLCEVGLGHPGK